MSGEARDGEKRVRRRGDRGPGVLNTRKCVNVNIWFGRSVALCEHSPHYGARLPRQRFITSASVPSSPSVALSSSPPSLSTLRHPTPVANPSFDISSTCCTYSLPLQCMILPPPRGDPSPLLHQSSSTLRRPERPRQKARCAPSLAAILAGSVARWVTCLALGDPVPSSPLYTCSLTSRPLPLEMRRTAKRRGPLRDVYPSPPPMPWLWPEAPRLAQGMFARGCSLSVSWGSHHRVSHPFHRKTIMSPCSVRRSRTSWRRRE
jgi:hypothetical protein